MYNQLLFIILRINSFILPHQRVNCIDTIFEFIFQKPNTSITKTNEEHALSPSIKNIPHSIFYELLCLL